MTLPPEQTRHPHSRNVPRASAVYAVAAAVAVLAACDNREQQKPKVFAFQFIDSALAQQADRVVPPAAISGKLAPVDETFALYAASSGLAEIEGAQLVLKSTRRNELRDYAEKLVREHQKSLDSLRRIVSARGLTLPPASTGRHADMVTKLAGVSAADRDEAFLARFGIDAHKETLALFERHAQEGKDAELKRYAQQTVPILREHMAAAQKLIYAENAAR